MECKLAAGTRVPEVEIVTVDGHRKSWSDLQGKWVVLMFRRYLGCPLCRREMEMLPGCRETGRDHVKEEKPGMERLEVLIIFQSAPEVIREALPKKFPPGITPVSDPEGELYRKFGVSRGTLWQYVAPPVLKAVLKASREGFKHGPKEGEERQLPADFIIDPHGIIRFARYGSHIADSTALEALLKIQEGLAHGAE